MIKSNVLSQKEQLIQLLEERTKKIKERLNIKDEPIVKVEEKKEVIQPKKTYNSNMLKVASILVVLALCFVVLMSINVPDFYEVIAVFFDAINPFGGHWGVDHAKPTDFVN